MICPIVDSVTLYVTSFKWRFFTYHQAMTHPHSNIIASLFNIPFVLKCAAKILKISLQIKIEHPKMFLCWEFCMEKLLPRKSLFSQKKLNALIFY